MRVVREKNRQNSDASRGCYVKVRYQVPRFPRIMGRVCTGWTAPPVVDAPLASYGPPVRIAEIRWSGPDRSRPYASREDSGKSVGPPTADACTALKLVDRSGISQRRGVVGPGRGRPAVFMMRKHGRRPANWRCNRSHDRCLPITCSRPGAWSPVSSGIWPGGWDAPSPCVGALSPSVHLLWTEPSSLRDLRSPQCIDPHHDPPERIGGPMG